MHHLCIFCRQRTTSIEHAWPLWLLKFIDPESMGRTQATLVGKQTETKDWNSGQVKVRCVCKGCNNGWMSNLETNVKPTISQIAPDNPLLIDASTASLLAAWSTKTAMAFEGTRRKSGRPRFYRDTDCSYTKKHLLPPSGTYVFLGRSSESWFTGGISFLDIIGKDFGGGVMEDVSNTMNGYVCTMVIGHLVLQVLGIRLKKEIDQSTAKMHHRRVKGDRGIRTIWPWPPSTSAITWPLTYSLTPDALGSFSDRFGPT